MTISQFSTLETPCPRCKNIGVRCNDPRACANLRVEGGHVLRITAVPIDEHGELIAHESVQLTDEEVRALGIFF